MKISEYMKSGGVDYSSVFTDEELFQVLTCFAQIEILVKDFEGRTYSQVDDSTFPDYVSKSVRCEHPNSIAFGSSRCSYIDMPRYLNRGVLIGIRASDESMRNFMTYSLNITIYYFESFILVRDRFVTMNPLFPNKIQAEYFVKGYTALSGMIFNMSRLDWFLKKANDFIACESPEDFDWPSK